MGYKGASRRWHFVKPSESRRNRIAIVEVVNTENEVREIFYFARCGGCGATTRYDPRTLGGDVVECSDCGKGLEVVLK